MRLLNFLNTTTVISPRCFNVSLSDWLGNVLSFEKWFLPPKILSLANESNFAAVKLTLKLEITKSGNVAFYNLFVQMNEVDLHAECTRKFLFLKTTNLNNQDFERTILKR